jgi:hypothetical protein
MILACGTNLHGTQPFPTQGLWWSEAKIPGAWACWSPPAQLIDTDARPEAWLGAGLCGPSVVPVKCVGGVEQLHVFATGTRRPTARWCLAADRV